MQRRTIRWYLESEVQRRAQRAMYAWVAFGFAIGAVVALVVLGVVR